MGLQPPGAVARLVFHPELDHDQEKVFAPERQIKENGRTS